MAEHKILNNLVKWCQIILPNLTYKPNIEWLNLVTKALTWYTL